MIRKVIVIVTFFIFSSCSGVGLIGYYEMKGNAIYKQRVNYPSYTRNVATLQIDNSGEIILELPTNCSGLGLTGLFTPITPPFPTFWFRSWNWFNDSCSGNFSVNIKPQATLHLKTIDSKTKQEIILEPSTEEGRWGYTKHIFPIKAKNLDSGSIIIEKDGQKTEVPFEYKYFKFWY